MGLIKSVDAPVSMAAFSMRDIEAQARDILARARQQAERLIAAAQQEALGIKQQAIAQGFAQGKKEGTEQGLAEGKNTGHAQALVENTAAMQQLIGALTQAVSSLDADRHDLQTQGIHEVVNLAIAIARRVTKRQGAIDPAVLTANIKDAIGLVVHAADIRIAVNPAQMATLAAELPALRMTWPQLKHIEMVEDATIAPGGARIFTAHGHVDGDLDVQLDRIVSELMPQPTTEAR